ncbi:Carnitinyl-CoA dehydratase [Streptomyces fumanus]
MSDDDRPRVRYEKKDHVARVTLDRPEVLNAMDLRTHEELAGVWDEVEADDDVRAVVLTGAGDRAFSVGQDLKERARLDAAGEPPTTFGSRDRPGWPRLTERFDLSKPVVARVNGYALGGGFELVLACELSMVDRSAVRAQLGLDLIPNRLPQYRAIDRPCLVIGFQDDLVVRPHLCREIADAVPGARYTEIPGCGHYGYLERPEEVNAAIVDFFAEEPR